MHRALDLPHTRQVLRAGLTASAASQYMRESIAQPSSSLTGPKQPRRLRNRAQLRVWFWATARGQRYSGGGYRIKHPRRQSRFFKGCLPRGAPKPSGRPAHRRRRTSMLHCYGCAALRLRDAFACCTLTEAPDTWSNGTRDAGCPTLASAANRSATSTMSSRGSVCASKPATSQRAHQQHPEPPPHSPGEENSQFGAGP